MLPAERGDVGEQRIRHRLAAAAHGIERAAEIDGVPERDRGGDEGQPARAVLQQLGRAVAQPAEAVEATARASALRLSPLFSSAVACRLSGGRSSQSRV